jgi:glycosyltransferase involved in cell wall biosynthesis
VYPPVDTEFYRPADDHRHTRSGFLVVSALVPYKRLDIAIDACSRLGAPLSIVGTGPEMARLRAAAGPDVTFLGRRSDEEIRELYRGAWATLLPGIEDFGMVPVEAQACGCPVVAFGEGGVAETVVPNETGILVEDLSADAFAEGLNGARSRSFDTERLRRHALQFSKQRFLAEFQTVVQQALATSRTPLPPGAAREDGTAAASRTSPRPDAAREDEQ